MGKTEKHVASEEDAGTVEEVVKEEPPAPVDKLVKIARVVEAVPRPDARVFARVSSGVVVEIINETDNIEDEWHLEIRKTLVDITDLEDSPKPGHLHKGAKRFQEPEIKLPPATQRHIAFRDGALVNDARFPVTPDAWRQLTETAQYASMFDEFPDGSSKLKWSSDPPVTFDSPAVFLEVYKRLSKWRIRWYQFDGKGHPPDKKAE